VRGEPFAQDARYHKQQDEVGRDRAEPDVEGPKWRQERDKRVDDVHPLSQDLGDDMDNEEGERAERDGPVHGLCHHPVSGRHHGPVGGHQADHDRGGQPDEREHSRVEQHEMLRRGVDLVAGGGHHQHEEDNDGRGGRNAHDLPLVVSSRSVPARVHTLTAA
jgi:hypothetical protein